MYITRWPKGSLRDSQRAIIPTSIIIRSFRRAGEMPTALHWPMNYRFSIFYFYFFYLFLLFFFPFRSLPFVVPFSKNFLLSRFFFLLFLSHHPFTFAAYIFFYSSLLLHNKMDASSSLSRGFVMKGLHAYPRVVWLVDFITAHIYSPRGDGRLKCAGWERVDGGGEYFFSSYYS